MKISLLVFTLLLAVTNLMTQPGNQSPADAQAWNRYTVEKRDLSVTMPKVRVLTLSKKSVEREHRHQESLKASVDNVTYSVLTSENSKPRLGLEEFIKEQLIRGWDHSSARNVTVNGIPGKEYLSKDRSVVAQFFVTERSLYRFLTKGAPADDPRVKQFFSSIELGKELAGTRVKPEDGVVYYFQDEPDVYKGKDVDRRVEVLAKPEPVAVATKDGVPVSMWMQLEYRFPF